MLFIKSPQAVRAKKTGSLPLVAAALACLLISGCGVVRYIPADGGGPQSDTQTAGSTVGSQVPAEVSSAGVTAKAPVPPNPYEQTKVDVPAAARALFADAISAMRQQQWADAEPLLQQLIAEYPQLSGPHLNLGLLYLQTDKKAEAEQAFRRAIDINPNNLNAYNQLAILKREQGAFAEAETYYQQALAIWPYHAPSHRNLGILYDLYLGRLEKALEHFEKYQALQETPNKQLTGWIVDLKRRIQDSTELTQSQQTAAAAATGGTPKCVTNC